MWRYVDERNYYIARVSALQKNVAAYRVHDGRSDLLGMIGTRNSRDEFNVVLPIDAERWVSLEVEFTESRFVVIFEGDVRLELTDTTVERPGKVGLWTSADSVTRFDAFAVSASQRPPSE